jgi:hypothetical protein
MKAIRKDRVEVVENIAKGQKGDDGGAYDIL